MATLFQGAVNHGAGTTELANLAGNASLPTSPLGSLAGDAAEQVAEHADAEHNADNGNDAEIDRGHPSTLRPWYDRRPKAYRVFVIATTAEHA